MMQLLMAWTGKSALLLLFTLLWSVLAAAQDQASPDPVLTPQFGHESTIRHLLWLQDENYAISGEQGEAVLWDLTSGDILRRFIAPDDLSVERYGLSVDVSHLYGIGLLGVSRWVVETGKLDALLADSGGDPIFDVRPATGSMLRRKNGAAYYLETMGHPVRKLEMPLDAIGTIVGNTLRASFTDDQQTIALWDLETVYFWDVAANEIAGSCPLSTGKTLSVRVSSDGQRYAAFRLIDGSERHGILVHTNRLTCRHVFSREVSLTKDIVSTGDIGLEYSPGGRSLVLTQDSGRVQLLNVSDGTEISDFGDNTDIRVAVFSNDGNRLLIARYRAPFGAAGTDHPELAPKDGFEVWDTVSAELIGIEGKDDVVWSAAFSPSDDRVVIGGTGLMRVYEVGNGLSPIASLGSYGQGSSLQPYLNAAIANGGRLIATARQKGGLLRLWNRRSGTAIWEAAFDVNEMAFTDDDQFLVVVGNNRQGGVRNANYGGKSVIVLHTRDGRVLGQYDFSLDTDITLDRHGRGVLVVSKDGEVSEIQIFDPTRSDGHAVSCSIADDDKAKSSNTGDAFSLTISEDRKYALSRVYGTAHLLDLTRARRSAVPDAVHLLSEGPAIVLHNGIVSIATGKQISDHFHGYQTTYVDGISIATRNLSALQDPDEEGIELFDLRSNRRLPTFEQSHLLAGKWVYRTVQATLDEEFLLAYGERGRVDIWDLSTGELLISYYEFSRQGGLFTSDWVWVTPAGRFNSSRLEALDILRWVFPDSPFKAYSPEIFLRDYFEPEVLHQALSKQRPSQMPDISALNRALPELEIAAKISEDQNHAQVSVRVRGSSETVQRNGQSIQETTAAYDVRIFRQNQLVGWYPREEPKRPADGTASAAAADNMHAWRTEKLIPETDGSAWIALAPITVPLPSNYLDRSIEFSAYAFNEDRVKSKTVWTEKEADGLGPRRRAYIVSVGVNGFSNNILDLDFAASDATLFQEVFAEAMQREAFQVIPISLQSSRQSKGVGSLVVDNATKRNIRAVIEALGGHQAAGSDVEKIPGFRRLAPAHSNDIVFLFFSTHGFTDETGEFYLLPSDVGAGKSHKINAEILRHAISSSELSDWLRTVDAGEIVLIIDACQSAGIVEREGFKPGPFGSTGLGQLAYDKRMRVLAASQSDNVAWESSLLQQGLLTYALLEDGIIKGRSDLNGSGDVSLTEWLNYGVQRVPMLVDEVRKGEVKGRPTAKPVGGDSESVENENLVQKPALFDFRGRNEQINIPVP